MFCWVLLAVLTEIPVLDVSTLDGGTVTGQLQSLTPEELVLQRDGETSRIPIRELLQVQPQLPATPPAKSPPANNAGEGITVVLRDGSRIVVDQLTTSGETLSAHHPLLGDLALPRANVASVRLAPADSAVDRAWTELVAREKNQDYLVIRKGDILDHLDGVIGGLSDSQLEFVLDGDALQVNRTRIFGWILADRATPKSKTGIVVQLPGGEQVVADRATWNGSAWELLLPGSTTPLAVPVEAVRGFDFSAGKVLFLSAVEPRDVEHVSFFGGDEDAWPYQRDRNLFGKPLKVGTRTFTRGLALHSKTRLVYRLGGDYRRLTGQLGLDPDLPQHTQAASNIARVTIRGDRKILFDADVSVLDPPVLLDLPVSGVIELEILVDYGPQNTDIGDRVHFGDLKVLQ